MREERNLLQKIVLAVLAAMILIFGVLTAYIHSQPGVEFRGELLQITEGPERSEYFGKVDGQPVEITVAAGEGLITVEVRIGELFHDLCRVEYPLKPVETVYGAYSGIRIYRNDALLFEGAYDPEREIDGFPGMLFDSSGELAMGELINIGFSTAGDPWAGYETTLFSILRFAFGPEEAVRGSWGLYAAMVILTLVVMLDAAFPMALFRWRYHFSVRNPEPTEFYIGMQYFSWLVLTVFLLVAYIKALGVYG